MVSSRARCGALSAACLWVTGETRALEPHQNTVCILSGFVEYNRKLQLFF